MSTVTPRQPFGVLTDSRIQALSSIKNRQNNVFLSHSSPLKSSLTLSAQPTKRRLASELLSDEVYCDSENVDPETFSSKRVKGPEGTPSKVSKFSLVTVTPKSEPTFRFSSNLTIAVPPVSTPPISHSRGSPTKNRRSLPKFKRLNPPSSKKASPLPFSIDAALQGSLSSYTPSSLSKVTSITSAATASSAPLAPSAPSLFAPLPRVSSASSSSISKSKPQPDSWFFDIHEDTAEQESTNLLLHNASVLDISSDDDSVTARAKDAALRGKENVPPPEYTGTPVRERISVQTTVALASGMMETDRVALREMDITKFWPEGKEDSVLVQEREVEEDVLSKDLAEKEEIANQNDGITS